MSSKVTELLTKETAGLPNWAWGLVIVGGAGVGYWFVRKNSSSATAAGSTTVSATGATDTSQSGANAVSQPSDTGDSIDYSSQLGAGANPGSPVYVLGTSPGSSGSNPNPNPPVTQSITIRQRQTSGPNAGYDKNNPGGVPIHQGTSGSSPTVGLQPFGSTVATTGPSIVGSTNSGSGSGGSDYWYPIANGYISSWDVVGIGGGGLVRPNKSITDALN